MLLNIHTMTFLSKVFFLKDTLLPFVKKKKKNLHFKDSVKTLVDTETSGFLWEEGWDLSVGLNAYFRMTFYILFYQ